MVWKLISIDIIIDIRLSKVGHETTLLIKWGKFHERIQAIQRFESMV
jgi:hypothetical protein